MPNDEQKPESPSITPEGRGLRREPGKVGWGKIVLGSLAYLAVGFGFILFMVTIAAVLLVGFLAYACGHH